MKKKAKKESKLKINDRKYDFPELDHQISLMVLLRTKDMVIEELEKSLDNCFEKLQRSRKLGMFYVITTLVLLICMTISFIF